MRLFALVSAAMLADLASFALIVPVVGIGAESNGIMARNYAEIGILGVAALKVVCTITILLLVARCSRPDFRRIAAGLGMTLGLVGLAGNLTALLR